MGDQFNGVYRGKRVLVTGHTGFKGAWLSLWLHELGARVAGYSLPPPTEPNLFDNVRLDQKITHIVGDLIDASTVSRVIAEIQPEIVFHLAAQSLVRKSYREPVNTYAVNVMGTVNVLEAMRNTNTVRVLVNVTSDKCYENREWLYGYREVDPLGGHDPYSSSKACSELVTAAYRRSFFAGNEKNEGRRTAIASARAGNVIGGGDWAEDRIIPDCMRALLKGEKIRVRSPYSIRPWQHVLDPLRGYLMLGQRLYEQGHDLAEAWNFGPDDCDAVSVEGLVQRTCAAWGGDAAYELDRSVHPHEARFLKLDCSKTKAVLGWCPRWSVDQALAAVVEWTKAYKDGSNLEQVCLNQIRRFIAEP